MRDRSRSAGARAHGIAARLGLRGAQVREDAQATVRDLFRVSGRAMIEALIAGQRNPRALAQLARGTLRTKTRIWKRR